MGELPSGTVTFLFTDVEGSTRLLSDLGYAYANALAEHRRVLREAFQRHGGVEVDTQGDAFFVSFASARDAVAAANEAQSALEEGPIRVRMGLHTGEATITDEGYVGLDVHRAARIAAAGHGGQVLASRSTRDLIDGEVRDLGEHRLKDLSASERLYQLGSRDFPPLKMLYRTNLPIPATRFVGRGRELAEVTTLLRRDDVRLLTLTGPGGTGKTRLALQGAAALADDYPDGVWWVPLAPLRDPALVLASAARAVGVAEPFAEHVADKCLLLLLDNFEHLVEAAPEVSELVSACPRLDVIVTSRELLQVASEYAYAVPSLVTDDARRLFVERSLAVGAQLEGDEVIDELCARLDKLPLALELAAARTRHLSPAQLLERLGHRLDLLEGGRDADPRQRTLRATIQWSHELLDEDERGSFARLSIFAGGCTLNAAVAVCDADLETVASLVDKSLVRFNDGRYWMLETIREYAAERLEESTEADELRRRHFDFFRAVAESANLSAEAEGGRRHEVVRGEHDNLSAAIDWSLTVGEIEAALTLAVALENFWVTRNPHEGMRRFEALLGAGDDASPVVRARALRCYGGSCAMAGDLTRAQEAYEASLALFRDVGTERDVAVLLQRLGTNALSLGRPELARPQLEASLASFCRVGSRRGEAQAIGSLGYLARAEGDLDRAVELFEQSATMVEDLGFPWWQAGMRAALAECALELGRIDEAAMQAREELVVSRQIDDRQSVVYALAHLASVAAGNGDLARAGRIWGAIEAEEARGPVGVWETEREQYATKVLAKAAPDLERGRLDGRRLSLDEAVEEALADA